MREKHYVNGRPIGASLAAALVRVHLLVETDDWKEFALVGRYNALRHLVARGWVVDVNEEPRHRYADENLELYARGEPIADMTPPYCKYPPRWQLTEAGRDVAEKLVARGVTTRTPT